MNIPKREAKPLTTFRANARYHQHYLDIQLLSERNGASHRCLPERKPLTPPATGLLNKLFNGKPQASLPEVASVCGSPLNKNEDYADNSTHHQPEPLHSGAPGKTHLGENIDGSECERAGFSDDHAKNDGGAWPNHHVCRRCQIARFSHFLRVVRERPKQNLESKLIRRTSTQVERNHSQSVSCSAENSGGRPAIPNRCS